MTDQASISSERTAVLFVSLATLGLSFKGIFALMAYETGMNVDTVLLLRFIIAAPLFWCGVVLFAKGSPRLTWGQWKACAAAGVLFFAATYSDFTAIHYLGATISRLILFTFPVIVMVLNAIINRTWPHWTQILVFIVTYAGIALVMDPRAAGDLSVVGMMWAFGCALTYGGYLIVSQQIMKQLGSVRFTAASGSFTLLYMLIVIPFTVGGLDGLTFNQDGLFFGAMIAVFCTVIPFFMLFEGIRRCGATQAALITLSGPVLTMLLAWYFLGETLNTQQIIGASVAFAGVASLKGKVIWQGMRKLAVACVNTLQRSVV